MDARALVAWQKFRLWRLLRYSTVLEGRTISICLIFSSSIFPAVKSVFLYRKTSVPKNLIIWLFCFDHKTCFESAFNIMLWICTFESVQRILLKKVLSFITNGRSCNINWISPINFPQLIFYWNYLNFFL